MLLRMIGEIKGSRDRFRCVLSPFSTSRKCFRNRSPSRVHVSPLYNFFADSASYAVDDIG